jgi:flagellar basal-body rod protein FlgC
MSNELTRAMASAASGMGAQSLRLRLIGENVANADTPGYHRKTIAFRDRFDAELGAMRVEPGRVRLSRAEMKQDYDPGHPLADADGLVTYSNVSTLIEIADAREAQRSYEANLSVFDQARRMYAGMLDLLRR